MVNRAILIGNLGQDPEVRNTQGGTAVTTLRIATTERRKDQSGQWADHTEWHTVVAFGNTAEAAGKYLAKGRQVFVEGRIQTRKWQDKDGRDRWSTEIVAETIRFLGGGQGQGQERSQGSGRGESRGRDSADSYGDDNEIPF